MVRRLFVMVCLFCIITGCGRNLTRAQLVGTYRAEYSYGTETLILKPDRTYEQLFKYNKGKSLKNAGKWEYSRQEYRLILTDALIVDDFDKPAVRLERMDWILGVHRSLSGRISLTFNPDLDIVFLKE